MATSMIQFKFDEICYLLSFISKEYKIKNFYLDSQKLIDFLDSDGSEPLVDYDCYDYLKMTKFAGHLHIVLTHIVPMYDGKISGRQADVYVDEAAVREIVFNGLTKSVLCHEPKNMPKLVFTKDAHKKIKGLDPLTKRALSKYMRDAFQWPRSHEIVINDDYIKDSFYFVEHDAEGYGHICGGIILHKVTKKIRGRIYNGVQYSTHT